jgi:hypothetical protein
MPTPAVNIQIFVKTMVGDTITLDVKSNDSTETIKSMVYQRLGIPYTTSLIFAGRELEPNHTLGDYGITKESTLHFVTRRSPIWTSPTSPPSSTSTPTPPTRAKVAPAVPPAKRQSLPWGRGYDPPPNSWHDI